MICHLIFLLSFKNRSRDRERRRSRERSDRKRRSRSRDRRRSRSSERKSHRHRSRDRERDRNQDRDRERDRERSSKDKGEGLSFTSNQVEMLKSFPGPLPFFPNLTRCLFPDRKMTEERSSSKKDKHSGGDAAPIKASSEAEPMETETAAAAPASSSLLNGQQELLHSEGDTQSN